MAFNPEKLISEERKNYRDVHWCAVLNEPVIIEYASDKPQCTLCDAIADSCDDEAFLMLHPFLFHIKRYTGESK